MFVRLPGVDVARFQESMTTGGLLGYVDALSGGSISRVGVFSLGEPLGIHAQILSAVVFQNLPHFLHARLLPCYPNMLLVYVRHVRRVVLSIGVLFLSESLGMQISTGLLPSCFNLFPDQPSLEH